MNGSEHLDVVIVGAGLSGIGAAAHLQQRHPRRSYAILEARDAIGGTWDLFRYPGVRSDSDMFTLGYAFKPWRTPLAIADGPAIRAYVRETAAEHGIERHVRFGRRLLQADWSSRQHRWTLTLAHADGTQSQLTCGFLWMCAGYYSYAQGHRPAFPGEDRFRGTVVHPQFWPEALEHAGKRVVVIGSGATAVTLVPEMAKTAAHVTMLQRSPTYIVTRPSKDTIAERLQRLLPAMLAYRLVRAKNVLRGIYYFQLARRRPALARKRILQFAAMQLPPGYDVATHLSPRYNPWDQRMCLVPDGDLFQAIRQGRASIVTSEIESFTEGGIRLKDGQELPADIVVTATGLQLNVAGDAAISIDGERVDLARSLVYRGTMFSGVPNLASVFGYTNSSWTLKADLIAGYVCRLLEHMDRRGFAAVVPQRDAGVDALRPIIDLDSGYVARAADKLPKQGSRAPWRQYQNYLRDWLSLRFGRVEDGVLRFSR